MVVLVHSPLMGPSTWLAVAEALRQRGVAAVTVTLEDMEGTAIPYWRQHADAVARALTEVDAERPLILVGHSGAGPLLPAIRQAIPQVVARYLFVDAGIPRDGRSRLDLIRKEDPEFAAKLRDHLASGGRFPTWSETELRPHIPDARIRQRVMAELRTRPLAFFEEPIPVFESWPDAPCGYLQFSAAYDAPAAVARQRGWTYRGLEGGHFEMLTKPGVVADVLLELVG